ncbi:MAG: hypothetical protein JSS91_07540 [Bacteroidetes bacterium]|nr:hypothetical protein [Bacteroidota bacterium]
MNHTLVLGFFREEDLNRGEVCWRGKYLDEIRNVNGSELSAFDNITDSYAYLIGKDNNDEKCFRLNFNGALITDGSLKVRYSIEDRTDFDSCYLRNAVRSIIPGGKLRSPFLPLCILAESGTFRSAIEDESILSEIKKLQKKNDWLGISKLTGDMQSVREKPVLWNNEILLNGLSFATAKLSETYVNLKFSFRNDEERKNFLSVQKKYREETVMLRKRCIELNPEKAAYYSNLGYSYYQFARELVMPGGRRDGKITEEAEKAIVYLNKALEIDPQRIPDLYRKGQLQAVILPPQILFGGGNTPGADAVNKWREMINEGIQTFKKIEEVWQILPLLEDKMTKRYQKEYIKSLYDISRAYSELAGDSWDITKYLLPLKFENRSGQPGRYEREKTDFLDRAVEYMEKCAAADNTIYRDRFPLPPVITLCRHHGVCDGIFKLYSMGKYYFQKYLILTDCDEGYFPEAEYYRKTAEEYLTAALRFPAGADNKKQSRDYIAEKLARVYISKGEYEKASEILKKYINERTRYYIKYTYSAACLLSGKYAEAKKQTESALKNERGNFEIWLGYFLLYVKSLRENDNENAGKYLKKCHEIVTRKGKKNPAGLLIGQAFISYKNGKREEAVRLLKEAEKSDPFRKGIREKIKKWEQNCMI